MTFLHPHVPYEFKNFSIHLIATFLGLLMALGLEQWREHHVEMARMKENLQLIRNELQTNRTDIQETVDTMAINQKDFETFNEVMERLVKEKRTGHLLKESVHINLGINIFSFRLSAWESAKAGGTLRNLESEKMGLLTNVYTDIEQLRRIQDAKSSYPWFQDIVYYMNQPHALGNASLEQFEQCANSFRRAQADNSLWIVLGKRMVTEIDSTLTVEFP
jgi:hypothetical protein